MRIFLLWATWAHEYMAIFVNINWHRMWGRLKNWRYVSLTKLSMSVR